MLKHLIFYTVFLWIMLASFIINGIYVFAGSKLADKKSANEIETQCENLFIGQKTKSFANAKQKARILPFLAHKSSAITKKLIVNKSLFALESIAAIYFLRISRPRRKHICRFLRHFKGELIFPGKRFYL